MRILIAEDDASSRALLSVLLEPHGRCDTVQDGQAALDVLQASYESADPYDLACLDIMMPNLDGQEVLKRLRALERERGVPPGSGVKVLMITALGDPQSLFTAFNEQCEGYLVKPIGKERLVTELRRLKLI